MSGPKTESVVQSHSAYRLGAEEVATFGDTEGAASGKDEMTSAQKIRAEVQARRKSTDRIKIEIGALVAAAKREVESARQRCLEDPTSDNIKKYDLAKERLANYYTREFIIDYRNEHYDEYYREALNRAESRISQRELFLAFGYDHIGSKRHGDTFSLKFSNLREFPKTDFFSRGPYVRGWWDARRFQREEIADPDLMEDVPVGATVGYAIRAQQKLSFADVTISAELGIGFDPFRTANGYFYGFSHYEGTDFNTFTGGVLGLVSGGESYLDGGVQYGPLGIRCGLYPDVRHVLISGNQFSVLSTLNPGLRAEWDIEF